MQNKIQSHILFVATEPIMGQDQVELICCSTLDIGSHLIHGDNKLHVRFLGLILPS